MSESGREVAEEYKSLFKGYCFNFEGLNQRLTEGFVKLVKEMGAEVSDDAPYIFVKRSYFEKKENNMKDNFYSIDYIVEAVEKRDPSNFLKHKFVPDPNHQVSNDEPMCYAAQSKTDSCQKCYYDKTFCKECVRSNEKSQKDTNQGTEANVTHSSARDSNSESENEIASSPKKKVEQNKSDSSKRLISSESEDHSNDEEQSESVTDKNKSPPRKKIRNSSDVNETLHKCKSLEIDVENNHSKSHVDSLNNFGKEKNGNSTKKKSNETDRSTKQIAVTRNRYGSSIEDDDSSDSSINERRKQSEKVDGRKSEWITALKTAIPPPKKEKVAELFTEKSDVMIANIEIDVEDEAYFRKHEWWLSYDIPENKQCKILSCSYEPYSHPVHYLPRRLLSLVEKKILVKYLIRNDVIENAKGKKVYENMIRDGYISHRTAETLKNCFQRRIMKEIGTYNLDPDTLNQFLALENKKLKLVKAEPW